MKLFIDPFSEFRLIKTQAAAWLKKHGLFSFHLVMKRPDFLYGCRQENQNRTQEHARREAFMEQKRGKENGHNRIDIGIKGNGSRLQFGQGAEEKSVRKAYHK